VTDAHGRWSPRLDLAIALAARTAAVVGSTDRGAAFDLWSNLSVGAETVAVHRSGRGAEGARVVARLDDLPFAPDICALAIGARGIVEGARDAISRGARLLVVPGLGPEDGELGAIARNELAELCDEANVPLVGPNCMGVAIPGGASAWIGTVPQADVRRGGVSCVVHSGSLGEALLHAGPRFGLRVVVSSGNEIGRDAADWLATLAADDQTTAIGLALETIRRPDAFAEALAVAARAGTPVIVLTSGRSQAASRAALAHSGAVVGSARGVAALCAAYGAISVTDVPDWLEHLEAFGAGRRLPGMRLVALTNSGGEGGLVADAAESAGLELAELPTDLAESLRASHPGLPPGNPVDYWAVGPAEELAPTLARACGAHPEIDGLVLVAEQSLRYRPDEQAIARAAIDAAIAAARDGAFSAVVSCATADADPAALRAAGAAGVPVLKGAGPALRALGSLARWTPRDRRKVDVGGAPHLPELDAGAAHLSEYESRSVLARYGVAGPREHIASTSAEAADAAVALGPPVVVKRHGPAHKERSGGVALGCLTPATAGAAAERIGCPVVVCEDLRGGVEVLCGMARDPTVGALVVVGVGGSLAEGLAGTSVAALAPLAVDEARALVHSSGPLGDALDERDQHAIADVLVALGRLAAHRPDVAAIDINPLRVLDGAAVALDALIVLEDTVKETQWISP
jgi:acetate---CoA ligase (ADP-forming)